jgi:hypothetical protein
MIVGEKNYFFFGHSGKLENWRTNQGRKERISEDSAFKKLEAVRKSGFKQM